MTHISITTTAITARRFEFPKLPVPRLGIGAAFWSVFEVIGQAYVMAYGTALGFGLRRSTDWTDPDLHGRDPNW